MPVSGAWAHAYAGRHYCDGWRPTVVREIRGYELFRKWVEAFAHDFKRGQEHKAAREKWRLGEARRTGLPLVFIEKGPEDEYDPVVRQILAANIRSGGATEQLLRNLLAVQKRLRGAHADRTK